MPASIFPVSVVSPGQGSGGRLSTDTGKNYTFTMMIGLILVIIALQN